MHPFLTRQKINYGFYLIEPIDNIRFNRALIMNIGFVEALRDKLTLDSTNNGTQKEKVRKGEIGSDQDGKISLKGLNSTESFWDCFIFHDVLNILKINTN